MTKTMRYCDAALIVLRETDNDAVMATDSYLLHAISKRAGHRPCGHRTEVRVLAALSAQPGELVPGMVRGYRNQRCRIFYLPEVKS